VRRILRGAAILAVVLAFLAVGVGWWALRASLPVVSGTLAVAGLSAPVSVIRDHASP